MKSYDHKKIEKKWQEKWEEDGLAKIDKDDIGKEKFYVLDMFPYPSGDGLHMGHTESYTATDIIYRYKRMKSCDVLHPQGFDSFGLPAENYAIKTGTHPKETTAQNIENYIRQMKSLGFGYDFGEKIITSSPEYYKWTQWLFTQFFEHGLVYKKTASANWCDSCKTVLANEQVVDGKCERCKNEVTQKEVPGWFFKITDFADGLIEGLKGVDWPEHTKKNQINWIGKSEGAEVVFPIAPSLAVKRKVLILHGFAGDPSEGWKPWLKKSLESVGFEVRSPKLPNTEHPDFDETMTFLKKETADFTGEDIIVGHSLGGQFALKLAEQKEFGKLVLVAPTIGGFSFPYDDWATNDPGYDFDACKRVLDEHPVDFTNIKAKERIAIFGTDDRGIPIKHADQLGTEWKVLKLDGVHHMSRQKSVLEILESIIPAMRVFTTRPDTLFGCTYCVLAPEHPLVEQLKNDIENWDEVVRYIVQSKNKNEIERTAEGKEKTGIELKGIKAVNPANGEEIPVFIADYVLAHYGTGAIMAVPAHDERDWKFAAKFNLPKPPVVEPYFVKNGGEDGVRDDKQTIEREAITAIVKHWTEDKYIVLKWKKVDWHTFITGGVENGQTPEEAARAEVLEETGYKDIKNASELSRFHSKFFHVPKDENRLAHFHTFYFELGSGEREIVSTDEQKHHEVLWLMPEETVKVLTPPGHLYVWNELKNGTSAYLGEGILANSEKFDGMGSEEAKKAITDFVGGTMTNTYRLRDWSISRQRYWGAPIPVVYDSNGSPHIVPEKYLPWLLPEDVDFVPTGTAPLAKSEELKKRTEEIFGKGWTPETDTMDTFVCSSWYYLRYPNPHNENMFCSGERLRRWLPVDLYIGGAEHTYMHLLYARFFTRAMRKIGLIDFDEPFLKLRHQGMVLDKNGVKMSKSKGNVVNPDEITERFGADAVRLYMMFAGPLDEDVMWNENGIVGTYRFLEKVWRLSQMCADSAGRKTETLLHKTIKKVEGDIEELKFNTAISAMMIFVNTAEKEGITQKQYEAFLKLLAPFAPHMTEELWCELGYVASIHLEKFPIADPAHSKDEERVIAVQIDGKTRDTFTVPQDADDKAIEEMAVSREMVKKWLNGKTISRIIVAKGKIVSIVTER